MNEKLYLFEREYNDTESDYSMLNYWTAHFRIEENLWDSVKFELQRFNWVFLGLLNYSIDEAYLNNQDYQNTNELNKSIRPGLNYLLNCSMPRQVCPRTLELMIINRGFGEIKLCVDVNSLTCPCCQQTIEKI